MSANQLINNLFQQIQDVRSFAVAGGQPCGDAMIVNVALTLVFNTGLFPDACCAWQARTVADKTWMQFKLDFAAAHREFHLTNQTAQQSGFHSANMMIKQGCGEEMQCTVDAIAQLATATALDRGRAATLTATNAKLSSQLEASQAYIKTLKDEIISLKEPAIQSACNHAHDTSNQKELINYLHAACFIPVKSTWIAAIKMAILCHGQD
jgi:hypothetical protein